MTRTLASPAWWPRGGRRILYTTVDISKKKGIWPYLKCIVKEKEDKNNINIDPGEISDNELDSDMSFEDINNSIIITSDSDE